MTAARLLAAAVIPLSEDEAYYRIWAGSLQFGYFDHPPMIAWWIRAGMSLAGDNALGVRLLPTLATGLTGLFIYDLGLQLGGTQATAARGAVWFNATFTVAMGGILATPDAAMTPFWVLTLWCLARTEGPNGRPWWIAAGVAAGLACLSKYSALFLAPGVIVWLVATPGGLARLKQPWPWLALVIAAAIFGLNVEWNATHHWLTFQKQFGRVAPHALKPGYVLELLAGQFLLLNPLIAIFAIQGARWPWKPAIPGRLDPTLLLSTSIPFAAYLAVHALHDRVQAHWPVPIYPALALVAAAVAQDATTGWRAGLRKAAAPVGLSLSALALIHLAVPGIGLKGVPDPSRAVRGWPVFISQVRQLQQTQQVGWIGTLSYGVDAQLSAQGVTGPIVELFERDRYPPSDSSWRADLSRPGLVIDIDRRTRDYDLSLCFNQVTPVANLSRGDGVVRPEYYQAFRVAGPRPDVLKDGCSAKPVRR